jgi:transposase
LAGTCGQAAKLLEPLETAIAVRNRDSWHLHADETAWRVFAPRDGGGPAKWRLRVFIGPGTVCFVMDPTRSGAVLSRHAVIDEDRAAPARRGRGPRRLVISSGFYRVCESAGKKADGLVSLFCAAHIRRRFVRAGGASPVQLKYRAGAWLERFRDLYRAHGELTVAWQAGTALAAKEKKAAAERLGKAHTAWDTAIGATGDAREKQAQAPGLQEPAKKALAALDGERDGLTAHRGYPLVGLDSNLAGRTIRGPAVTRNNAGGSRNEHAARNAATVWAVTATVKTAGLNILTCLTACLDEMRPKRREAPCQPPRWNGSCPGTPAPKTSEPGHSRCGAAPERRHAGHRHALSQDSK